MDGTDGAYLQITHSEDIYQLFDDPSPVMHKELVVDYELMGVGDTCQEDEMKDHVVRPLGAKIAPKFAPLILVQKVRRMAREAQSREENSAGDPENTSRTTVTRARKREMK